MWPLTILTLIFQPQLMSLRDPHLPGLNFALRGGPPQCLGEPYDTNENLAFTHPVVAKDVLGGAFHKIANINDGNYGNGVSWIGTSANSWIKIDLGQPRLIDRVTFGRDRLGFFGDRPPGNFTVELALTENVFANGDATNDSAEYVEILDSLTATSRWHLPHSRNCYIAF